MTNNPHGVTPAQLGLGNVNNTSDMDKPVSAATQNALNGKVDFPGTNQRIPVRGPSGEQTSLNYTTAASGSSVMMRNSSGQTAVAAGTGSGDAVNKGQMDAAVATKVTGVNTSKITVSVTEPTAPVLGDIWFRTPEP